MIVACFLWIGMHTCMVASAKFDILAPVPVSLSLVNDSLFELGWFRSAIVVMLRIPSISSE